MSLFGTIESTTSSNGLQIASQPFLSFLYPALRGPKSRPPIQQRRIHRLSTSRPRSIPSDSLPCTENIFINALVRASTCQRYAVHTLPFTSPFNTSHHKPKRKDIGPKHGTRNFGAERVDEDLMARWSPDIRSVDTELSGPIAQPSKEELMSMVAMYQSINIREEKQDERRGSALPPDAAPSALATSNDLNAQHSRGWDPLEPVHETIGGAPGFSAISRPEYVPSQSIDFMDNIVKDQEVRNSVLHHLWQFRRLLDDSSIANEVLFEAYRRLPAPRVTYLGLPELRRFLARLSWNKKVTEPVLVRFLSVLDDMKAANIEILGKEWNTAIHFAGRFAGQITVSEVESALHMWREMEREAGVQSDTCSFNILFDLASKAKKFALASMILKEMKARKLPFSRITRMSLIYYHGLCGDGDGVRQEYANMVAAGEIIDSNVLTNVITSLIHAGEPSTAEQTFERMKTLHAERTGATLPPRGWEANRRMRKVLTEAAERWRDNPEARSNIQEAAPLAPSLITYRVLIEYHSDTGNFDRTFSLLDEMERAGLQPDGTTYYWLLAGFAQHGGVRYSAWTWTRLEQTMAQCFAACEERPYEAGLGRGIAAMAVRAFAQCANIERAREIWEDIKLRWTPSEDTITTVHTIFLKKRESSSF